MRKYRVTIFNVKGKPHNTLKEASEEAKAIREIIGVQNWRISVEEYEKKKRSNVL